MLRVTVRCRSTPWQANEILAEHRDQMDCVSPRRASPNRPVTIKYKTSDTKRNVSVSARSILILILWSWSGLGSSGSRGASWTDFLRTQSLAVVWNRVNSNFSCCHIGCRFYRFRRTEISFVDFSYLADIRNSTLQSVVCFTWDEVPRTKRCQHTIFRYEHPYALHIKRHSFVATAHLS